MGGRNNNTHGSLDKILFDWLFSGLSSDKTIAMCNEKQF